MKKVLTVFAVVALAACLAWGQTAPAPARSPGQAQPGQAQPGQAAAKKPPAPKSQAEFDALQQLQKAVTDPAATPDAKILAAEEFLARFPDSELKYQMYMLEMQCYQDKNDAVNTLDAASKVLKDDPENLMALVTAAGVVAMRTRDTDLDRDQKWKMGEDYAHHAITLLNAMVKPEQLTEEQFQGTKNSGLAQAYGALGLIAVHRKEFGAAEEDFKKASELEKDPLYVWHLGRAYAQDGKYDLARGAYKQSIALGGVKDATGHDLAADDLQRLEAVVKQQAPAAKTPPPPPTPEL
jgi:tetratricopeptide (TPR) repeat protein